MFVVLDGIDWSWKWTQIKLVKEALESQWKTVKIFDFPRYDEPSSYFVKRYLNWEYWEKVSPKLASQFYAIDRFEASFEIRKALEEYDYVLSNRYVSASMIHQSGKIKDKKELREFLNWLDDLEFGIYNIPRPDKVIFLNVEVEVSRKLIKAKEKREYIKSETNKDLHEKDVNHLTNSYNAANFVAELFSDWTKITCSKNWEILPIETITEKILKEIL